MTLVRQVVVAVSLQLSQPWEDQDGEGVAAGFMLGAEAVQVGTRFAAMNLTPIQK